MIAHVRGTVHRLQPGKVSVDVGGVGYLVTVPLSVWETLNDDVQETLLTVSYIREDRFDLYGFREASDRELFEQLTKMPGIGPSLAIELCGVPRSLLLQAINEEDSRILTAIKGIGAKRAEKLLLELKSLMENHPSIFLPQRGGSDTSSTYDRDAMDALQALGYDNATIMHTLKKLSPSLSTTEERVAAALRSL